jgi:hypothetical protein
MNDPNLTNHLNADWKTVHGIWEKIRAVVAVNLNLHNARAYCASNITGPTYDAWTIMTLDTENWDPNGNFASNAYTCPVAGRYAVKAGIHFRLNSASTNGTVEGAIYNGATQIASIGKVTAFYTLGDQYHGFSGGDVLNCAKGDVITLKYYVAGPGGTDITLVAGTTKIYMAVHRVS